MTTAIGLDLAYLAGVAYCTLDKSNRPVPDSYGCQTRLLKHGKQTLADAEAAIDRLLDDNKPGVVFVEDMAPRYFRGARTTFALHRRVQQWCERNGVPLHTVSPTAVKKLATGRGNAKKRAMFDAAELEWPGLNIPDDNAADALWVLRWGELKLLKEDAA